VYTSNYNDGKHDKYGLLIACSSVILFAQYISCSFGKLVENITMISRAKIWPRKHDVNREVIYHTAALNSSAYLYNIHCLNLKKIHMVHQIKCFKLLLLHLLRTFASPTLCASSSSMCAINLGKFLNSSIVGRNTIT